MTSTHHPIQSSNGRAGPTKSSLFFRSFDQVIFEIDTRRTNNVLLFFHEPGRAFVVEDLFGMDVLQLPKVTHECIIRETNFPRESFFFRKGALQFERAHFGQDGEGDDDLAGDLAQGHHALLRGQRGGQGRHVALLGGPHRAEDQLLAALEEKRRQKVSRNRSLGRGKGILCM